MKKRDLLSVGIIVGLTAVFVTTAFGSASAQTCPGSRGQACDFKRSSHVL